MLQPRADFSFAYKRHSPGAPRRRKPDQAERERRAAALQTAIRENRQ